MARYSYRQVSNAVCEILRERGVDHVQPENSYYVEGTKVIEPMCFVGHVFHKVDPRILDRIVDARQGHRQVDVLHADPESIYNRPPALADDLFAPAVWDALRDAQHIADTRHSWGLAAEYFHETYREAAHKR